MLGCRWTVDEQTKQSSDMLREEERKGGGMGGQRNFMCNPTAERSAFLQIPHLKAGHQASDWVESYSSVTDLTHFVNLLLPPFFLPVNWR